MILLNIYNILSTSTVFTSDERYFLKGMIFFGGGGKINIYKFYIVTFEVCMQSLLGGLNSDFPGSLVTQGRTSVLSAGLKVRVKFREALSVEGRVLSHQLVRNRKRMVRPSLPLLFLFLTSWWDRTLPSTDRASLTLTLTFQVCLLTTGHRSTNKRDGDQQDKLSPLPQRAKVMSN